MKTISQVPYKEVPVNFMIEKSFVGYSFELDGKSYGHKSQLKTKKRDEVVAITATLAFNAIASMEAIKNGENSNK